MKCIHIIKRSAAKDAGLIKYFSTSVCQRSHYSERYTKGGGCVECSSEKQIEKAAIAMEIKHGSLEERERKSAERKEKRRIKQAEHSREYYAKNTDRCKARSAAYAKTTRGKEKNRESRKVSSDRPKSYLRNKEWKKRNPLAVKAWQHKRRAIKAGAEGSFTKIEIEKLFFLQSGKCAICTKTISREGNGKFHMDHIQPLIGGGSNWISNIQLTCARCNLSKGCKDPIDFAQKNGKLL